MDETRACPYCAETIRAEAVKCKYCGESVAPRGAPPVPPPPPSRPRPSGDLALVLGIIALAGNFICAGAALLLGPFAWAAGSRYEKECAALGLEPESNGKVGKICGIVATILLGVGILAVGAIVIILAAAAAA